jgi:peptidoglycan/LPS O-acetylase OafA/YrhL
MIVKTSRHIPAIDGLRAVAVVAVITFHLGISWLPGGFLGVDLFFVISGYVITRLLLDSIAEKGKLDLREFYRARARRILPALFFMLILVTFVSALWKPDAIHGFLVDLPFVLTATQNWHLVTLHQNYFDLIGRPPLLQHTWSLAVEAQFYFIWPLIVMSVLKYFRKKSVANISLAIAGVSGIALFFYSINSGSASSNQISHIYFGSDTHSIGMFLGAALAVRWAPQRADEALSTRARDYADAIGIIGFVGLLASFLFIDDSNPTLYKIAFPIVAFFGCAAIFALVNPSSRLAPMLSSGPVIWIGQRSYGIYLWHWVIFQFTRPTVDLAGQTWAIDTARVLLVLALADISFTWIETPFRRGLISHWVQEIAARSPAEKRRGQVLIFGSISLLILLSVGASLAALREDLPVKSLTPVKRASPVKPLAPTLSPNKPGNLPKRTLTAIATPTPKPTIQPKIWVTGDSIILGTKSQLATRTQIALVDAKVGRQIGDLIQAVKVDRPGLERAPIVLDLGNNSPLAPADIKTLLDFLESQPRVVVINTAVPRGWRDNNNRLIGTAVLEHPNAALVDWQALSTNHPEYFVSDGVHLTDAGIEIYVNAIMDALSRK